MALKIEDFEEFETYRKALAKSLKAIDKTKEKFMLMEIPFPNGKKYRVLIFGKKLPELRKHFTDQHFKIVAFGSVERGASNTVLFEPRTGKLTDQDLAKLKILGDAKVGNEDDDPESSLDAQIPGMNMSVKDMLSDVRDIEALSKRWNHDKFKKDGKALIAKIRGYLVSGGDELKRVPKLYEALLQIKVDMELVPELKNRMAALANVLQHSKANADASKYAKEADDAMRNGSLFACGLAISNALKHLPGGPKYTPEVAEATVAASDLAKKFSEGKATLEKGTLKILNDKNDDFNERQIAEAKHIESFLKTLAGRGLYQKLVALDKGKLDSNQAWDTLEAAILILQEYLNTLNSGWKGDRWYSNPFVKMLQGLHQSLSAMLISVAEEKAAQATTAKQAKKLA